MAEVFLSVGLSQRCSNNVGSYRVIADIHYNLWSTLMVASTAEVSRLRGIHERKAESECVILM